MEENHEEVEDVEASSSDSFIDDNSEDDGPSTSGRDDNGLHMEVSFSGNCVCVCVYILFHRPQTMFGIRVKRACSFHFLK